MGLQIILESLLDLGVCNMVILDGWQFRQKSFLRLYSLLMNSTLFRYTAGSFNCQYESLLNSTWPAERHEPIHGHKPDENHQLCRYSEVIH